MFQCFEKIGGEGLKINARIVNIMVDSAVFLFPLVLSKVNQCRSASQVRIYVLTLFSYGLLGGLHMLLCHDFGGSDGGS